MQLIGLSQYHAVCALFINALCLFIYAFINSYVVRMSNDKKHKLIASKNSAIRTFSQRLAFQTDARMVQDMNIQCVFPRKKVQEHI